MIPTMIIVGLILGVIPALQWRWLVIASVIVSIGFGVVIAVSPDGSIGSGALAFLLALVNTAVGVAIGVGIVALVRRVSRGSSVHGSS